jgi:hypothetical protein
LATITIAIALSVKLSRKRLLLHRVVQSSIEGDAMAKKKTAKKKWKPGYRACPHCNAQTPAGGLKCVKCGKVLRMKKKKCPDCGKQHVPQKQVCDCGYNFRLKKNPQKEAQSLPKEAPKPTAAPKKKAAVTGTVKMAQDLIDQLGKDEAKDLIDLL